MSDNDGQAVHESAAGGAIEPVPPGGADVPSGGIATRPAGQINPETLAVLPTADRYHGHFLMTYIVLGVALAASIAGAVVLATGTTSSGQSSVSADSWSTWHPASGTVDSMLTDIENHVSSGYQLNTFGTPLDQVIHRIPPSFNIQGQEIPFHTLTVRQVQGIDTPGDQKISVSPSNTVEFQLLGTKQNSSGVSAGLAGPKTLFRQRLLRREALEIGLYSLKYVPGLNNVLVFLPGEETKTPAQGPAQALLLLTKDNMKAALGVPIYQTLKATTPPLPTDPDTAEQGQIDSLSSRVSYFFGLGAGDIDSYAKLNVPSQANPTANFDMTFDPWPGIAPA